MHDEDGVRVDRWLFAIRVFKTRSASAKAIAGGRVKVNQVTAKAHKRVKPGDVVTIKRDGRILAYTLVDPIERRLGAAEAKACYTLEVDPGLDPEVKQMMEVYRQLAREHKTQGRPTKRDRRRLERMRGGRIE